jgi:hypothetical protein
MPKHIADEDMLLRMGLTDKELQEIETKFSDLVKTLDAAQIHVLKQSTPTAEAAAKTLGPEVTAEHLMEFIRKRAPHDATMVICFNGVGHRGGH